MITIEIIASRVCSHCGQTKEVLLQEIKDHTANTTPWIMYQTQLYKLPAIECCSVIQLPTHIHLKSADNELFSSKNKFKIGSEDVPVITDESLGFAVTRTYKEQVELQQQLMKQTKLWERQKDEFFNKTYTYFSVHFEQIIDEMDHQEVLDILRTFEDGYVKLPGTRPKRFVYKGKNERKLITKWIKKEIKSLAQEESEEIKKYLFFLIVDYFVHLKLIPQISYLKWDSQKFEKMIGESLLMYLLMAFPLTSYFSFLKDEAILRLTHRGQFQKELRQLLEKTQKELVSVSNINAKLQQTIESQRKAIADLEGKNEKLRLQQQRLEDRINETDQDLILAKKTQKIRELKGIVNDLQEEVKQLRLQLIVGIEAEGNTAIETKVVVPAPLEKDFSLLNGKTVGIFGDIQYEMDDNATFPCKILSCESLRNPNAVGILKESDILVVLTQHISHSCMWSIKEFANQHDLPVIYSRHTNVEIIIEKVLSILK